MAGNASQSSYNEATADDYQPGYTIAASGPRTTITTDQTLRPELRQSVDRWGNVLAINDARSLQWITHTRYNRFNQVIEQVQPEVALATGGATRPTTRYQYDLLGRLIASIDANGNLNCLRYDAAGQRVEERHADGGIVLHQYDALGNEVAQSDPNSNLTRHLYDRLNRRIATVHAAVQVTAVTESPPKTVTLLGSSMLVPSGPALQNVGMQSLTDTFAYDEAGRRIATTNGHGETTRSRYDLRGNLIELIQPMDQRTSYTYDVHNRQTSLTDANGRTATWAYDDFGLLLAHTDIGGAVYTYRYDAAGQLIEEANSRGQHLQYRYDPSGLLLALDDIATDKHSSYRYDAAGRRIAERTEQAGVLYQDNTLRYDSLGRLGQLTDSSAGRAEVRIGYDAMGNRVHIETDIASDSVNQHTDGWYRYDSMHRQVVVNAINADGDLGQQGRRIVYDLAGNRIRETWWGVALHPADTSLDGNVTGLLDNLNRARRTDEGYTTATYTYDPQHRLIATHRDGATVEFRHYDASGPRATITIDQAMRPELRQRVDRWGNVLAVNDLRSLQWITTARYNSLNQQACVAWIEQGEARRLPPGIDSLPFDLSVIDLPAASFFCRPESPITNEQAGSPQCIQIVALWRFAFQRSSLVGLINDNRNESFDQVIKKIRLEIAFSPSVESPIGQPLPARHVWQAASQYRNR